MQQNAEKFLDNHPVKGDELCDICRIVDVLLEKSWTLTFAGDSVSHQSWAGLDCEILRRGYNVTKNSVEGFKDSSTYPANRSNAFRYKIRMWRIWTITNEQTGQTARLQWFAMYKPNPISYERYVFPGSNIVVFDHSVHYHYDEMGVFEADMAPLLASKTSQQLDMLIWREQTAQHFNAYGGMYVCTVLHNFSSFRTMWLQSLNSIH